MIGEVPLYVLRGGIVRDRAGRQVGRLAEAKVSSAPVYDPDPVGLLVVEFHIEDADTYRRMLAGEIPAFSVEDALASPERQARRGWRP